MCGLDGKPVYEYDAAVSLLRIVNPGTNVLTPEDFRKAIRTQWDAVKRLAHQIHDEETAKSTLRTAIENVAVLDSEGWENVINGRASSAVIKSCQRVARAILGQP